MLLFKYLKKEHLADFKTTGSLLINTLYNLRSVEYEPIRDGLEGSHKIRFRSKGKYTTLSGTEYHKIMPQMRLTEENSDRKFYFGNGTEFNIEAFDAYVFCTSLTLEGTILKKFGYSSYFQIIDSEKFGEKLFERINERCSIDWYRQDAVKYRDKPIIVTRKSKCKILKQPLAEVSDICFCKPKKFKTEKEYRFVYFPTHKKVIEPMVLLCPELRKYCFFP